MSRPSPRSNRRLIHDSSTIDNGREGILRLSAVEAHDLWSQTYDRIANPLLALEERTLEPLLPKADRAFVLDVACGTGRWLEKLMRQGAGCAVGIDLSRKMLVQGRRKPLLERCLVQADGSALPVRTCTVDLAICSFAVSYVRELDGFAGELARVLRSGGALFLSDFHPSGYARGWRRCFRHEGRVIEISSFDYSLHDIRRVFAAAGFKRVCEAQPNFGEEERSFFQARGKEDLFAQACNGPAIYICGFVRA
ncbi:MAG: class I SAM-dependent methyltransferase [Acidobacteriia bacterium]|nr:class I SAM-dependent methyltransferase [Terriglobia bacterium]